MTGLIVLLTGIYDDLDLQQIFQEVAFDALRHLALIREYLFPARVLPKSNL